MRRLNLSYDWQEAMIRAAISLKLSNFEETGGIVAAHTTSIPEAPGSGRTWDYRFCWLRDAYFVVKALNRIGATQTMEDFIFFILNIASGEGRSLRPVYSVVPTDSMEEWIAPNLKGYRGDGPVRVGNAAAVQAQHDTYGSIILATMPMFFDRRLPTLGDETLFRLLETMGESRQASRARARCRHLGISRAQPRPHPFGRDVLGRMQPARGDRPDARLRRSRRLLERRCRPHSRERCSKGAWNEKRKAYTAAFGSDDLDASVLLLPELGVIEANDPRFLSTVAAIERELLRDKHVMRYASPDDFGMPEAAFLICRFWLIDAWWALGRKQEARDLFVDALQYRNRYGLLSEDIHLQTGALWGNFPADLFDGRPDSHCDAAVAKLGGSVLARLVVVSNRVAVPKAGTRAGGLEVALAALKRHPGLWFGWSGRVVARQGASRRTTTATKTTRFPTS